MQELWMAIRNTSDSFATEETKQNIYITAKQLCLYEIKICKDMQVYTRNKKLRTCMYYTCRGRWAISSRQLLHKLNPHFVHGVVGLKAEVFKLLVLSLLVSWLYPGHQLLVAVACIELLRQRADSNTARRQNLYYVGNCIIQRIKVWTHDVVD